MAETVATFGLGYCSKGIMADRIAIPIHNTDGELVAYAGRSPGEPPEGEGKYKFPPKFSKSVELFNLHRARKHNGRDLMPFVVVEGFFDAMRLWQFGYRRTVALMGSSLSEPQTEAILKTIHRKTTRMILFFDEDEAGRRGREQALARLASHAYVRVVELQEEGLQPEHFDRDALRKLL